MIKTLFRLTAAAALYAITACAPAAPTDAAAVVASTGDGPTTPLGEQTGAPSTLGRYLAGRVALNAGEFPLAAGFLNQALAQDPDDPALLNQAMLADVGAGEVVRATERARRLRDAGGESPLARLLLAADALQAGQTVVAERHFEAMGSDGVMAVLQPLAIGWARAAAGAGDAAIAALKPLEDRRGVTDLANMQAGMMRAVVGDDEQAAARFAPLFDDEERPALRHAQIVAGFHAERGAAAAAQAVKAAYLAGSPDSFAFDGVSTDALNPIRTATDGLADSVFALASVLNQEEAYNLALVYAQLALHLRPDLAVARMLLAGLHERRDRPAAAEAIYLAEPDGSPFAWTARLRLAETMEAQERIDDAVAALAALADERPDRYDALSQMGDTLRAADRFQESAAAYDRAIERIGEPDPRHWAVFYARGIAHEQAKNWPAAEADLQRALALSPDQPYVLNYLGYSWVDQGVRLDEGLEMIRKAVEQRPRDGFIVDSLGWAYYRLGRFEDAVSALERAVGLQPQDPTINDHLGDAYWRVGRRTEAGFQWRRALEMGPDDDLHAQIEEKIEDGLPDAPAADAAGAEPDNRG